MGAAQQRPRRRPCARRQGRHLPPVAHDGGPGADRAEPVHAGHPAAPTPDRCAGDLAGLVARWTRPLDREERAVASVVGAARHEEDLRAGLDAALVAPLAAAVSEIGARAAARGEPVEPGRLALLGSVLEAFWWQRFTAAGDGAMTSEQVESVVDDVLLPLVGTRQAPAGASRRRPPASEAAGGRSARLQRRGLGPPGVAGRQFRRQPADHAEARLHLAQQPVGERPDRGTRGSGRSRRSDPVRCWMTMTRAAESQTAAVSGPAVCGSAGASTASSRQPRLGQRGGQPALRLVDQLTLVRPQRVRGVHGDHVGAAIGADEATRPAG